MKLLVLQPAGESARQEPRGRKLHMLLSSEHTRTGKHSPSLLACVSTLSDSTLQWQLARKNLKGPNPPSFTEQAKKVHLELSGTKLITDTFYPLDDSASICTLTHIEFPYKNSKETIFLPNKNSCS